MVRRDRYIVGLDVGTSKVCAVIGEVADDDVLEIVGVGVSESRGQKRGVVVNIDSTVDSIKEAVEEAELMAGVSIDRAYVGVAGPHIRGFNSRGVVNLDGRAREIDEDDVRRAVNAARDLDIPDDREIVHLLPREFVVDEQDGIVDPVGMTASRLSVSVHLAVGSISAVQNLVTCANRAGIEVQAVVLKALASNEAILAADERDLGVALVDIGGGTTNVVCYHGGTVWHTAVLPIGGDHFTNDIAVGLRTPLQQAEQIKQRYGCVADLSGIREQSIRVEGIGGRDPRLVPRRRLCEILTPRVVEILDMVRTEILQSGCADMLHAGIVLTGGGSLLEGMAETAELRFGQPVRVGVPVGVEGMVDVVSSPLYSTAVGLALHGHRNRGVPSRFEPVEENRLQRFTRRITRWFGEVF